MTNLSVFEIQLAKLIKDKLDYDDGEWSPAGFYFIPFKSFALELCQLLWQTDSSFDENEFLTTIGFEKITDYLLIGSDKLNKQ